MNGIDYMIDLIFSTVDNLVVMSCYKTIDCLLEENMNITEIDLRLAYLTITGGMKSKLKQRKSFYDKTIEILKTNREKDIPRLMQGLE